MFRNLLTSSFPGATSAIGGLSPFAVGQSGGGVQSARASAQELYAQRESTFTQVDQVVLEKARQVQTNPEMAVREARQDAQELYNRDKAGLSQVGGGAKFTPLISVSLDGAAVRRRESELEQTSGPEQSPWRLTDRGLKIESNKPEASFAVVDVFGTQANGRPDHGEVTSAVAVKAGQLDEQDLLRVDTQTMTLRAQALLPREDDPRPFGEKLDEVVTSLYTTGAEATTEAMQEIREHHPSISTVSQSQGLSAPKITEIILNLGNSPQFAEDLRSELRLPPDTPLRQPEALVALAGRVQATLASSAAVKESRQSLNAELDLARGQRTYYQSAGNDGEIQGDLAKAGFQFDPEWVLAPASNHPNTITVGAGTAAGDLAEPTKYTQRAEVDFAMKATTLVRMDGQDVCSQPVGPCKPFEGSSFSTPLASGWLQNNPENVEKLPPEQILRPQPGSLGLGLGLIQRD